LTINNQALINLIIIGVFYLPQALPHGPGYFVPLPLHPAEGSERVGEDLHIIIVLVVGVGPHRSLSVGYSPAYDVHVAVVLYYDYLVGPDVVPLLPPLGELLVEPDVLCVPPLDDPGPYDPRQPVGQLVVELVGLPPERRLPLKYLIRLHCGRGHLSSAHELPR
jgi:hypothetical protein